MGYSGGALTLGEKDRPLREGWVDGGESGLWEGWWGEGLRRWEKSAKWG